MIRELDAVTTLVPLMGHTDGGRVVTFPAGTRGTVVADYGRGFGYMVEVVRQDGTTAGFVDVAAGDVSTEAA